MVSVGEINKDSSKITEILRKYNNYIASLNNSSWMGQSNKNAISKAEEFVSEYQKIVSQMNDYASAVSEYEKYKDLKRQLNQTKQDRNNASQENKSSYDNAISNMEQDLEIYRRNIEQYLNSAASINLEATSLSGSLSGNGVILSSNIQYKTARYAGTSIWYAIIPKGKMPNLAIANDNYDYLSNERPTDIARRNNAKLAINFGLTGDAAGMIYTNGRLVNDTGNPYDETLYMAQDGTLNSVKNSEYSTQDIIDLNPVWASKGFYPIIRDGEYVDENVMDPDLSVDKHPRTFIGQDYDGNYIVGVCDGRGENEAGLTLREVYDFVTTEVSDDVRFLFNGDGGGSSAFIYDGEKLNSDTDGEERERPDLIYWTEQKSKVNF